MEFHRSKLRILCRLCGSNKGVIHGDRHPYCKLKFTSYIKQGLSIDVEKDDENIHPPSICHTCRVKIDRWKKARRNKKNLVLKIILHNFEPHSESCSLCFSTEDITDQGKVFSIINKAKIAHPSLTIQSTDNMVQFVRLSTGDRITSRLIIHNDFTWSLTIHGKPVFSIPSMEDIPEVLTVTLISDLVKIVGDMHICTGNIGFEKLCEARSDRDPATFKSVDGKTIVAFQENKEDYGKECIRHVGCQFIVSDENMRCEVCKQYRSTLSSALGRIEKTKTNNEPAPKMRNTYLSRSEITAKLTQATKENRSLKRKVATLSHQLQNYIEKHGAILDSDQANSFKQIMQNHESDVLGNLVEDSSMRILWEEQKKALKTGRKTAMRWHPAMIKWCIALHSKSAAAYKMVKSSGALVLPHEQTIRKYIHYTTPTSHFNVSVLERIKSDINFDSLDNFKHNVILLFDEMKIKDGLVYNRSTGKLVGFVDHEDIIGEIETFVNNCSEEDTTPPLATHMLALMIRGIFLPLNEVFAHYPCEGFTSYQLYWTLWRAVGMLEKAGFKVRAFCSDGASPNRKFYRLHQEHMGMQFSQEPCYSTTNIYSPSRKIYFICDPPHLMKTFRNNWENSKWNKRSRNLHYNKQDMTWPQLVKLYEEDLGDGSGLRRLPRISHEHIYLTPSLRMKVKHAVQVLSSSVASAFRHNGRHDTQSTVHMITMMDKFFDCLNVNNRKAGNKKSILKPYYSVDDWRFEWLSKNFLSFLNDWEDQCLATPELTMVEKRRMCISRETLEGLRITVFAFVALCKELLQEDGVKFIYSEKFSQDPLEEYFSKQRGIGGGNTNPSVQQFQHQALTIQVAGNVLKGSRKGNCNNNNAHQ